MTNLNSTIKGTKIIGLDIISIKTGEKLETVTDILYDPYVNKVIGILVDTGGWFSDSRIILTQNIVSVGKDAVMVEDKNVIQIGSEAPNRVSQITGGKETLQGDEVMTESGEELGVVSDIYVHFPGGNVSQLEVSKGFLGDLNSGKSWVKIEDIITVGEDRIIVKNYTKEIMQKQGETQGLQGAFKTGGQIAQEKLGQTQEFVSQKSGEMGQKAQELGELAKIKSMEIGELIQTKTTPLIEKTKEKTGQLGQMTKEKLGQTKEYINSGNLQSDAQNKLNEVKDMVSNARQNVSQTTANLTEKSKEKINESKDKIGQTAQNAQTEAKNKQMQQAIGKRVINIDILDKMDNILARPRDLVTHELIKKAIENDVIDQLLANCE